VVLLVHDQHKILGCYIIGGKNDLAEWQKLTVGVNKGTKLAASPFSTRTRKTATSTAALAKFWFPAEGDHIKQRVAEFVQADPMRKTVDELNMMVSSEVQLKRLQILDEIETMLGDGSTAKVPQYEPGSIKILHEGTSCLCAMRMAQEKLTANAYRINLRQLGRAVADPNKLDAYLIVITEPVETDGVPKIRALLVVPTRTRDGTHAFSPSGGLESSRSCFVFSHDGSHLGSFKATARQYSIPEEVTVISDLHSPASRLALLQAASDCQSRPLLSAAELESVLYISDEQEERERKIRRTKEKARKYTE
jgi:hypothetical protein